MDNTNIFADLGSSDLSDELDDFIFLDDDRTLINNNAVFAPFEEGAAPKIDTKKAEEPPGNELDSSANRIPEERNPKRHKSRDSEQKRRNRLNERLAELRDILPAERFTAATGRNVRKEEILTEAIGYINELRERVEICEQYHQTIKDFGGTSKLTLRTKKDSRKRKPESTFESL